MTLPYLLGALVAHLSHNRGVLLGVPAGAGLAWLYETSPILAGILTAVLLTKLLLDASPDTTPPTPEAATDGGTRAAIELDLDTSPLTQAGTAAAAAPTDLGRLAPQLPARVGDWERYQSRFARISSDSTTAQAWRCAPDVRHFVTIRTDTQELDAAYEFHYRIFSVQRGVTSQNYYKGFDTAEDAAAYAIHWMETYPDGGPGPSFTSADAPDPAAATPLDEYEPAAEAAYTIQTDPDTNMTTITQHGDL